MTGMGCGYATSPPRFTCFKGTSYAIDKFASISEEACSIKKSKLIFVAVSGDGFLKLGTGLSPSATTFGGRYCLTSVVLQ
jgi:hypothetical protein